MPERLIFLNLNEFLQRHRNNDINDLLIQQRCAHAVKTEQFAELIENKLFWGGEEGRAKAFLHPHPEQ